MGYSPYLCAQSKMSRTEYGNEPSVCMKGGELLGKMCDWHLPRKTLTHDVITLLVVNFIFVDRTFKYKSY
jgi:hypothetical protein